MGIGPVSRKGAFPIPAILGVLLLDGRYTYFFSSCSSGVTRFCWIFSYLYGKVSKRDGLTKRHNATYTNDLHASRKSQH